MKKLFILFILCAVLFAGCASDDLDDGLNAFEKGDYATALREWKPLAEEGDAWAQFNLGLMYKNGWGVPQDYKESAKWWKLSAEDGLAEAQYNLGLMYYNGLGVPQDAKEAIKWFRLAAEQGLVRAQSNLGVAYYEGWGVTQDYILAHMWYNLAASNGDEEASEDRDDTAKEMTPEQIERAQDLARACVAKDYQGC